MERTVHHVCHEKEHRRERVICEPYVRTRLDLSCVAQGKKDPFQVVQMILTCNCLTCFRPCAQESCGCEYRIEICQVYLAPGRAEMFPVSFCANSHRLD